MCIRDSADAAPADLVLVRRTDAARGRPDFPLASPRLRQHIKLPVVRQDDVSLFADEEPAVDVDARPGEFVDLLEERLRIDDDTIADDAGDAGMQNARRNQMQDELRPFHKNRMTGVVATLIPRDSREMRRQHVDDLALAFVAPLRAEHCDVHRGIWYNEPPSQRSASPQ